ASAVRSTVASTVASTVTAISTVAAAVASALSTISATMLAAPATVSAPSIIAASAAITTISTVTALASITPVATITAMLTFATFAFAAAAFRRCASAAAFSAAGHFLVAFGHCRSARQPDTAFLVHTEAFDPDFIAHLDDVFGLLDAEVRQFADVNQAVFAREELDEAAKFLDRDNFAPIDLADLGFSSHAFDRFARDLHAFFGHGIDLHRAIVLDVDFATGLFDDALDVLATRPDQRADLLRVDFQRDDARGVLAQVLARRGDRLRHFAKNRETSDARLLHGL